MTITLTREEAQVPLIEQLESVPEDARLRIDDADRMGTHYFPIGNMCHEAAKALRAKLNELEQEPVLRGTDYEAAFYKDWNAGKVRRVSDGKRMVPEREWVGLTDEELLDLADMAYANDLELLQTLQAKIKEKNNG